MKASGRVSRSLASLFLSFSLSLVSPITRSLSLSLPPFILSLSILAWSTHDLSISFSLSLLPSATSQLETTLLMMSPHSHGTTHALRNATIKGCVDRVYPDTGVELRERETHSSADIRNNYCTTGEPVERDSEETKTSYFAQELKTRIWWAQNPRLLIFLSGRQVPWQVMCSSLRWMDRLCVRKVSLFRFE